MGRKRKQRQGRRLSVWIPEEELWVFDALRQFVLKAEDRGLPLKQSEVAREILVTGLHEARADAEAEVAARGPLEPAKPVKIAGREWVIFRGADRWVMECVRKLVEGKRLLGFKTSVSYEIVRLIKNALLMEAKGGDVDRTILGG